MRNHGIANITNYYIWYLGAFLFKGRFQFTDCCWFCSLHLTIDIFPIKKSSMALSLMDAGGMQCHLSAQSSCSVDVRQDRPSYYNVNREVPHLAGNKHPSHSQSSNEQQVQVNGLGKEGALKTPTFTKYYDTELFFKWEHVKDKVYGTKPATINELKAAIKRECAQMPNLIIRDVCDSIALRCRQYLDQKATSSNICDNNLHDSTFVFCNLDYITPK